MKTKSPKTFQELLDLELSSKRKAAFYLNEALKENDMSFFLRCVKSVVDQNGGMKAIADKAGVSRSSLYKALSGERNPSIGQVEKVLECLGFKLAVVSVPEKKFKRVA